MSKEDKIWIYLMELVSNRWGCHQLPERSFFINKYQFPMCARCTGVLIGYIVALVTFMRSASYKLYMFMCIPMLIDWLIQYLKIRKSNNTRRFFTGLLCGYGFLKICLKVIFSFIRIIVKQLKY